MRVSSDAGPACLFINPARPPSIGFAPTITTFLRRPRRRLRPPRVRLTTPLPFTEKLLTLLRVCRTARFLLRGSTPFSAFLSEPAAIQSRRESVLCRPLARLHVPIGGLPGRCDDAYDDDRSEHCDDDAVYDAYFTDFTSDDELVATGIIASVASVAVGLVVVNMCVSRRRARQYGTGAGGS